MRSALGLVFGFLALTLPASHHLARAAPPTCDAGTALANTRVRQPQTDYTVHGNGTVTHHKTGLMWKVCAEGQTWSAGACSGTASTLAWSDALTAAKDSSFVGYADWRLPNKKELESLAETCGHSPAINKTVFPGTPSASFWTSTSYAKDARIAWPLNFSLGAGIASAKLSSYHARLVRGGQTPANFDVLNFDTTPDAFSFSAQTGVPLTDLRTSNSITVGGVNPSAIISVSGGEYAINGGAYTSANGTVSNGDSVTVRQTSSASYLTQTTATLTVGGASANFEVTTQPIPPTPPTAPTGVMGTPGNTQIVVAFTAPSPGTLTGGAGASITGYTADCGGHTASGPNSPLTVGGLSNGTPYTCTVTATNNVPLTGPAGTAAPVTPRTVPDAPTIGAATPGNTSASVAFSANGNGGAAIDNFRVSCNPGSIVVTGAASPINLTGLSNGTAYTCSAAAHNVAGWSAESATVGVTPRWTSHTAPSATGSGSITASFTGGGSTCTYTTAQFIPLSGHPASPPAGSAPTGVNFPHGLFDFVLANCTPGSTVTVTITYPSSLPANTQYWKYGPTAATPAPHWYVLPATLGGNSATFSITDGGLGDDDLTANGSIVDQGGPGNNNVGAIPTLSGWGLLFLSTLLGLAGLAVRRRW